MAWRHELIRQATFNQATRDTSHAAVINELETWDTVYRKIELNPGQYSLQSDDIYNAYYGDGRSYSIESSKIYLEQAKFAANTSSCQVTNNYCLAESKTDRDGHLLGRVADDTPSYVADRVSLERDSRYLKLARAAVFSSYHHDTNGWDSCYGNNQQSAYNVGPVMKPCIDNRRVIVAGDSKHCTQDEGSHRRHNGQVRQKKPHLAVSSGSSFVKGYQSGLAQGDWRRELAMKECGDNFYKYQKALAGSESTYSRRKVSTKRQKSDEVLDRGNHRHSENEGKSLDYNCRSKRRKVETSSSETKESQARASTCDRSTENSSKRYSESYSRMSRSSRYSDGDSRSASYRENTSSSFRSSDDRTSSDCNRRKLRKTSRSSEDSYFSDIDQTPRNSRPRCVGVSSSRECDRMRKSRSERSSVYSIQKVIHQVHVRRPSSDLQSDTSYISSDEYERTKMWIEQNFRKSITQGKKLTASKPDSNYRSAESAKHGQSRREDRRGRENPKTNYSYLIKSEKLPKTRIRRITYSRTSDSDSLSSSQHSRETSPLSDRRNRPTTKTKTLVKTPLKHGSRSSSSSSRESASISNPDNETRYKKSLTSNQHSRETSSFSDNRDRPTKKTKTLAKTPLKHGSRSSSCNSRESTSTSDPDYETKYKNFVSNRHSRDTPPLTNKGKRPTKKTKSPVKTPLRHSSKSSSCNSHESTPTSDADSETRYKKRRVVAETETRSRSRTARTVRVKRTPPSKSSKAKVQADKVELQRSTSASPITDSEKSLFTGGKSTVRQKECKVSLSWLDPASEVTSDVRSCSAAAHVTTRQNYKDKDQGRRCSVERQPDNVTSPLGRTDTFLEELAKSLKEDYITVSRPTAGKGGSTSDLDTVKPTNEPAGLDIETDIQYDLERTPNSERVTAEEDHAHKPNVNNSINSTEESFVADPSCTVVYSASCVGVPSSSDVTESFGYTISWSDSYKKESIIDCSTSKGVLQPCSVSSAYGTDCEQFLPPKAAKFSAGENIVESEGQSYRTLTHDMTCCDADLGSSYLSNIKTCENAGSTSSFIRPNVGEESESKCHELLHYVAPQFEHKESAENYCGTNNFLADIPTVTNVNEYFGNPSSHLFTSEATSAVSRTTDHPLLNFNSCRKDAQKYSKQKEARGFEIEETGVSTEPVDFQASLLSSSDPPETHPLVDKVHSRRNTRDSYVVTSKFSLQSESGLPEKHKSLVEIGHQENNFSTAEKAAVESLKEQVCVPQVKGVSVMRPGNCLRAQLGANVESETVFSELDCGNESGDETIINPNINAQIRSHSSRIVVGEMLRDQKAKFHCESDVITKGTKTLHSLSSPTKKHDNVVTDHAEQGLICRAEDLWDHRTCSVNFPSNEEGATIEQRSQTISQGLLSEPSGSKNGFASHCSYSGIVEEDETLCVFLKSKSQMPVDAEEGSCSSFKLREVSEYDKEVIELELAASPSVPSKSPLIDGSRPYSPSSPTGETDISVLSIGNIPLPSSGAGRNCVTPSIYNHPCSPRSPIVDKKPDTEELARSPFTNQPGDSPRKQAVDCFNCLLVDYPYSPSSPTDDNKGDAEELARSPYANGLDDSPSKQAVECFESIQLTSLNDYPSSTNTPIADNQLGTEELARLPYSNDLDESPRKQAVDCFKSVQLTSLNDYPYSPSSPTDDNKGDTKDLFCSPFTNRPGGSQRKEAVDCFKSRPLTSLDDFPSSPSLPTYDNNPHTEDLVRSPFTNHPGDSPRKQAVDCFKPTQFPSLVDYPHSPSSPKDGNNPDTEDPASSPFINRSGDIQKKQVVDCVESIPLPSSNYFPHSRSPTDCNSPDTEELARPPCTNRPGDNQRIQDVNHFNYFQLTSSDKSDITARVSEVVESNVTSANVDSPEQFRITDKLLLPYTAAENTRFSNEKENANHTCRSVPVNETADKAPIALLPTVPQFQSSGREQKAESPQHPALYLIKETSYRSRARNGTATKIIYLRSSDKNVGQNASRYSDSDKENERKLQSSQETGSFPGNITGNCKETFGRVTNTELSTNFTPRPTDYQIVGDVGGQKNDCEILFWSPDTTGDLLQVCSPESAQRDENLAAQVKHCVDYMLEVVTQALKDPSAPNHQDQTQGEDIIMKNPKLNITISKNNEHLSEANEYVKTNDISSGRSTTAAGFEDTIIDSSRDEDTSFPVDSFTSVPCKYGATSSAKVEVAEENPIGNYRTFECEIDQSAAKGGLDGILFAENHTGLKACSSVSITGDTLSVHKSLPCPTANVGGRICADIHVNNDGILANGMEEMCCFETQDEEETKEERKSKIEREFTTSEKGGGIGFATVKDVEGRAKQTLQTSFEVQNNSNDVHNEVQETERDQFTREQQKKENLNIGKIEFKNNVLADELHSTIDSFEPNPFIRTVDKCSELSSANVISERLEARARKNSKFASACSSTEIISKCNKVSMEEQTGNVNDDEVVDIQSGMLVDMGNNGVNCNSEEETPAANSKDTRELDATTKQSYGVDEMRLKELERRKREIEQTFRKDCTTFVQVVKLLVSKDPSLKLQLEDSFRQCLAEMGRKCVEELESFAQLRTQCGETAVGGGRENCGVLQLFQKRFTYGSVIPRCRSKIWSTNFTNY